MVLLLAITSLAIAKRTPMMLISTPVAAVRHGPSWYHCAKGNSTTPIRTA
jgi:hypothetical protein